MSKHEPLRGDTFGVRDGQALRKWDRETDVVVVGLGAAGGSAAIEAATHGAEVIAIDRFGGGGATGRSAGIIYFGGGTALQQHAGYRDSPENMFEYLKLEVGDAVSAETLTAFCERSVESFEALRRIGVPFPPSGRVVKASYPADDCTLYFSGNELCHPYATHAEPAPRGHRPLGRGLTGHLVAGALQREAMRIGVHVSAYTRAEQLVVSHDGDVLGVVVSELRSRSGVRAVNQVLQTLIHYGGGLSRRVGTTLQEVLRALEASYVRSFVRARKGVVLSSGGFVFNRALVREQAPQYADCSMRLGTAGDDGSGIALGASVGGATGRMDRCSAWRFIDPPSAWVKGVFVGRNGERICNEELYGGKVGEHLVEEYQGRGTLIVDAAMMAKAREQIWVPHVQRFQRAFALLNGFVTCRRAPTLARLAEKLDIDGPRMIETIATYNEGVRKGVDAFGKRSEHLEEITEPPFYGIPLDHDSHLFPTPWITLGGLQTEGLTGRVLRADGSAIDGLYAAGRTAVGVSSNGYVSGLSVADGLFSGRNAGRHAAERFQ